MHRKTRVLIVTALFAATFVLGLAPRAAAEQTNVLNANVDVKASGSGAHCWANATATDVWGVTSGELIHLQVPYKLNAPGGADDAYAYLTVWYNGGTYSDSKHEGQGPSTGYLQVNLNANPGAFALYQVQGLGTDWWGGSTTCNQYSNTVNINFRA